MHSTAKLVKQSYRTPSLCIILQNKEKEIQLQYNSGKTKALVLRAYVQIQKAVNNSSLKVKSLVTVDSSAIAGWVGVIIVIR